MKVDPRYLDGLKPIRPRDVFLPFGLAIIAVISWLFPERMWPTLARWMAGVSGRAKSASADRRIRRIQQVTAGYDLSLAPEAIVEGLVTNSIICQFQIMRSNMPGDWYPDIEVIGRQNLEAACEASNGVLIGASYFCWCDHISVIGGHKIGHPVSIITAVTHGYSSTKFGVRYLNPIRCRLDEKYSRERIPLFLDRPVAAMRTIFKLLKEGHVVAFAFRENAMNPMRVPFLNGGLDLGTGLVDVAYKSGVPLLSTHALRIGEKKFRLIIDREIEVRRDLERHEAARLALEEYARRLEPLVLAYPDQWSGWRTLPDA